MIKSVEINNFQSHARSTLEFSPGVNIIIGSSDSGKSAIIRALRWLVWNRPSGDAIKSSWGGSTSVSIQTEMHQISRIKDKQDSYLLTHDDGNDTEFKAIGTSVPEEISRILNINEINLQQQLDSPFLLSKSPGEVATHFNKVAKLDMIDKGVQNINSWIRALTSDIKYKTGQKIDLEQQSLTFAHLEKLEIEIEVLEELEKQYKSAINKRHKLLDLCANYQEVDTEIDLISDILKFEQPVNTILKLADTLVSKINEKIKLERLLQKIDDIEKEMTETKEIVKLETSVNTIITLSNKKEKEENKKLELFKLKTWVKNTERAANAEKTKYEALVKQYEEVFPDICPLCGIEIK